MNSIHFCAVLKSLSCVRLFATLWTIALCPWRFSRQESWSGWPCPPPGYLPDPGIEPVSPALQVEFFPAEPPGSPSSQHHKGNPLPENASKRKAGLGVSLGHVPPTAPAP